MPKDVHKALELLEEYHTDLFRSSDLELKYAIERVIGIFKSNLFSALCDLQDFYDGVLLNERIGFGQKVVEARNFADRWERSGGGPLRSRSPFLLPRATSYADPVKTSAFSANRAVYNAAPSAHILPVNRVVDEFGREWEVEEVLIDTQDVGMGFSISGGQDRGPDKYVRITDIHEDGAVARDGRIRVGDVILKVNDVDCVDVLHQFAVNALSTVGPSVKLMVKRLKPMPRSLSQSHLSSAAPAPQEVPVARTRSLYQLPQRPQSHASFRGVTSLASATTNAPRIVSLRKGDKGLGFNIVGGEDGEPIYVSHVMPGGVADMSGNVRKGDVLLRVNDVDLNGANHTEAAMALKSLPADTMVHLLLQYRPREYHSFDDRLNHIRNEPSRSGYR